MMGNGYMMENLSAEDQQKMLDQMNVFFTSTMAATGATCRILLITGLYFGISRVNRSLTGRMADPIKRMKVLLLLTIFALSVVNIFLKRYLG